MSLPMQGASPSKNIFKGKPTTFLIAAPLFMFSILAGIGYVAALVVAYIISVPASDGLTVVAAPVLVGLLAYVAVQVFLGIFIARTLIKGMYNWSKNSIAASSVLSPLIFWVGVAVVCSNNDMTLDLNTSLGISMVCVFSLSFVLMGAVAYNDIKYRLPSLLNKTR